MSKRYVIVNADDFGQSRGVNLGIAKAHEHGVVTSASLMVRYPHAAQAADYARENPTLGVGLHFDLGEWALQDGEWLTLYQVVDLTNGGAVADELRRQLDMFAQLLGGPPTHIDSHQHKHLKEPVRSIVCDAANRYGIAVRGINVPYCGKFYGQDEYGVSHPDWIAVPALIDVLAKLEVPVCEIACHPSAENDLHTMYGAERLIEAATLSDPRVRNAVSQMGITLASFANWPFLEHANADHSDHGV